MSQKQDDLRIVRTRKAIMDALVQLIIQKDFSKITVTDITNIAVINRATFYYHFTDKYELLIAFIKEKIAANLLDELANYTKFDKKFLKNIFLSIAQFHVQTANLCRRNYDVLSPNIETVIRKELEVILMNALKKENRVTEHSQQLLIASTLSWTLYGASVDWFKNGSSVEAEDYFSSMIILLREYI